MKIDFDSLNNKYEAILTDISENVKRIGILEILKCDETKVDRRLNEIAERYDDTKKIVDNVFISSKAIERFIDLYMPIKI